MLPSKRQNKIIEMVLNKDVVTIPEFVEKFNISVETIRRDLNILEKMGKIEKVYGGAKFKDNLLSEPAMDKRMISNLLEKEAIGKKCADLINDGDCIFIDSGSTTFHIAKYLSNKKKLTIITNSIPVINELLNKDFEIIIIGGKIRHEEHSIVTFDYIFNFSQLNIHKSFICAGGISLKNGISDYDMQEAVTRKAIIERSSKIYIAADSSKFMKNAPINIIPISQVNAIISDSNLNSSIIDDYSKHVSIIID